MMLCWLWRVKCFWGYSRGKKKDNVFSNTQIRLGDNTITPVPVVKNLGVYLDRSLTMENQVKSVIKTCNFQLRNISKIRSYLTEDACRAVVQSLVTSQLDYCNSLLIGLPKHYIKRLQSVQYSAARLVKKTGWMESMNPTGWRLGRG